MPSDDAESLEDTPIAFLPASRDDESGQLYVPRRAFSVDGMLRALSDVELTPRGTLSHVIAMGDRHVGYVDLPGAVRLLGYVDDAAPQVGEAYAAWLTTEGKRVYRRAE